MTLPDLETLLLSSCARTDALVPPRQRTRSRVPPRLERAGTGETAPDAASAAGARTSHEAAAGGATVASMQDTRPRRGYADLLSMPDDGRRYEIHGGELVMVPAPIMRHQFAAMEIAAVLNDYRRRAGGLAVPAPFDVVFGEHDVLQPDVVFFRAERLHLLDPDGPARAAPDLVVEVLSPSTARLDRGRKMRIFASYAVPEYWIVDPLRQRIEVHVLDAQDAGRAYRRAQDAAPGDAVRSVVLPGLAFDAARVFALPRESAP